MVGGRGTKRGAGQRGTEESARRLRISGLRLRMHGCCRRKG